MSWKPEVITDSSGKWYTNALRFATKEEAEANVLALSTRWLTVREFRASESSDPVSHAWVDGELVSVSKES